MPHTRRGSAEVVRTAAGRRYHIGLAPGDVAPVVLLAGDPARAERVAERFDRVEVERRNREFATFTGRYRGHRVSAMGTGIGPDNLEIVVVELAPLIPGGTLLRIGSCGALAGGIRLGDLVISTGAVRLENTTSYFVHEGYPAVAHHEAVLALAESCRSQRLPYHVGLTATAPGFYGAQGRRVPGFAPRFPGLPRELAAQGVLNMEMEVSSLLVLAALAGLRAGAVCAVFAQRRHNRFVTTAEKHRAEERVIAAGLGAVEALARIDAAKRRAKVACWDPGIARP